MIKTFINIILAIISVIIALLISELIVRTFVGDKIVLFPCYAETATYGEYQIRRNIPNSSYKHTSSDGKWSFKINNNGFRSDKNYSYNKSPDTLRILLLGDSFTLGWEVDQDEMFSVILENYLNNNGIGAEVLNAGVSGFGTAEELIYYENEGYKYKPDIIILGFYGNDFDNNIMANLFTLDKNKNAINTNKSFLPAIKTREILNSFGLYRWLSEHSYLQNYIRMALSSKIHKKLLKKNKTNITLVENSDSINKNDDYFNLLTFAIVERIYNTARKNGTFMLILDIPKRDFTSKLRRLSRKYGLISISDTIIFAAEYLQKHTGNNDLYRPNGYGHWTGTSHEIIGLALGDIIMERIIQQ